MLSFSHPEPSHKEQLTCREATRYNARTAEKTAPTVMLWKGRGCTTRGSAQEKPKHSMHSSSIGVSFARLCFSKMRSLLILLNGSLPVCYVCWCAKLEAGAGRFGTSSLPYFSWRAWIACWCSVGNVGMHTVVPSMDTTRHGS